jgi:hypothetical protein
MSYTASTTREHLIQTTRHGLRTIQYRGHLVGGCFASNSPSARRHQEFKVS